MRIKELWISKYKNLENITFTFNNRLTSLLVGLNGVGKSNLLEAISIIFRDLDLSEKEENLTTNTSSFFFEYYIEYSCKGNEVKIDTRNSMLKIETRALDSKQEFNKIGFSAFKRDLKNRYVPDAIIGYYSGENKRIREIFDKHSQRRQSELKGTNYRGGESILGWLFFTEQNFGELIFFTLWVFKHSPKYRDKIEELLNELIKIDFDSHVEIEFCNPDFYKNYPDKNADDLFENIDNKIENPFWGIKGKVDQFLKVLYNNNLEKSIPISFIDPKYDSANDINEFVKFKDLNFNSLLNDILGNFDNPVKFFDVLQAADSIGIIHKINSTIVKHGAAVTHNFKELSEGEQQLLTTIGLLLIVGEFDALFLYDEPDTHLNPQWQREYARLIKKFNLIDKNSHIIVSTHSPLIVQSAENADLILFKSLKDEIKIDYNPHRIHNWRIDQVLQSEYFGLISARPPSLDTYMAKREKLLNKQSIGEADENELKEFENEFGVLPTGETLTDLKAMQVIYSILKS